MKAYIRSAGIVSPQDTFNREGFPENFIGVETRYLNCVHPDYKQFIAPASARRMGKVLKMGVAAATSCLNLAGNAKPDAIIVGTGMGCVEDTDRFLLSVIDNNESLLTPTSFIQLTHNTVGGQIALLINCNGYNFTYVHRGFSFESAVYDAIMQFEEGAAQSVLVGGVDEMTENFYSIFSKLNHWKGSYNNLDILRSDTIGTLPGEGASFFLLTKEKSRDCYATVDALKFVYRPTSDRLSTEVERFMDESGLSEKDIDLVVVGVNGHVEEDKVHYEMLKEFFPDTPTAGFKHLCGEYPTASAFGFWFAATVLKTQTVPDIAYLSPLKTTVISRVLFCNNFRDDYFSLTLLSKC